MEGQSDYTSIGVTTEGDSLNMQLIVGENVVSPRIYLLDEAKEKYEMLQLTGKEFAFDVEVSHLPCGMNSALYLSEMLADGGKSDLNTGGAAWGTGYCDAQCYVTRESPETLPSSPRAVYSRIRFANFCCRSFHQR